VNFHFLELQSEGKIIIDREGLLLHKFTESPGEVDSVGLHFPLPLLWPGVGDVEAQVLGHHGEGLGRAPHTQPGGLEGGLPPVASGGARGPELVFSKAISCKVLVETTHLRGRDFICLSRV